MEFILLIDRIKY